jgi:ABC-type lipoprotein release transport system permease subunit
MWMSFSNAGIGAVKGSPLAVKATLQFERTKIGFQNMISKHGFKAIFPIYTTATQIISRIYIRDKQVQVVGGEEAK